MSLGVSIRALAKGFDGKTVLSNVSLEAPPGRSTVLIGPSAAGKTVLLRCVLGLEAPDRGEVALGGAPPGADGLARVGVLFQRDALFDGMTVWENVAFRALQRGGGPRRAARERALALLADVGLSPGRRRSTRRNCPAGCASAPASPGRWPTIPNCWSSTTRRPGWTRR